MSEPGAAQFRVFSSNPGTKYVLPIDDLEKDRLIRQHYLLKGAFDNKLITPPEVNFQSGDEILDPATGAGIWLQDLASTADRSISLHGIDIESLNFPPPSTYPPNIHLRTESLLSLPYDWTSKFTFVNQRLVFMSAIHIADAPLAFSEIHRVLKPDGWVQLLEIGNFTGAGPLTEKSVSLVSKFNSSRGIDFQCHRYLPWLLSTAGFEDISTVSRSLPLGKWAGELGERSRDNILEVLRGMKKHILDGGGFGVVNSEEEFDRFIEGLEREWNETRGAEVSWVVVYGRKSGTS